MAWLSMNFKSDALNMPVMVDILMPQGHGNYRTLYLLHGAGGDHTSWITKSQIADYVEGKDIAVIMPSGNNKCYINNKHGKDYFSFIADELVEKCETRFSLSKHKSDRFIAGMSMGGYGAIHAALERPQQYALAASYSGLLNILERYEKPQGLDLYPVFGTKEELQADGYDLFEKAEKKSTQFTMGQLTENVDNSTHFLITCGLQDPRYQMSEDFYHHIKQLGYQATCDWDTGAHNWEYWNRCIKQTIQLIESQKWNE